MPAVVCFLSLAACEKPVIRIDLPAVQPKLVIACFISPQDPIIKVQISKSTAFFGPEPNPNPERIKDATVIISEGGNNSAPFTYTSIGNFYFINTSSFPVIAGKTYCLIITTPDGLSASALCTVPGPGSNTFSIDLDSLKYISQWGDTILNYSMIMTWTDAAGQLNYYRPYGEIEYTSGPDTFGLYTTQYSNVNFDNKYIYNIVVIDDKGRDGQNFTIEGSAQLNSHNNRPEKLIVCLIHTDKNYFLYHESISRSYNYGSNPFAEPALIYSNVNNGLGIFAAFSKVYTEIQL